MSRLLIYVHYNKYNTISSHVKYQLKEMNLLFSKVIFVSNSHLSEKNVSALFAENLIHEFIQRGNTGYDFAAWKEGLEFEGLDNLGKYDSVTVMNDTCFGPLWDMESYYQKYENDLNIDFWGMTNHAEVKGHNLYIPEHLQSYFISFKKRLVQSDTFFTFWKSVQSHDDVQKVIDEYETQFTKIFTKAGFNYTAVLDTVPIHQDYFHRNFTIHYPQVLLDYKVPFIKIKTFDLSQHLSPYTIRAVGEETNYPVELIESHMTNVSIPTPAYLLDRKVINPSNQTVQISKTVAVHLHTFYLDLLPEFLTTFKSAFSFAYDLFLTTDTEEKKLEIEEIVATYGMQAEVLVTGKKGRDVVPMLKLKDRLSKYDFIGHFHTKKSPEYPHWVGDSWRNELFEMLIKPANGILSEMSKNENVGLVIADIPSFFRYTKIVDPWNENRFADDMNTLWERMGLERKLDFTKMDTFIMSYGTFVWFKYDALKPLFDLDIQDDEIPAEPLPQHTILHAIERILMYIAWAKGYDYRISKANFYITPFVDNKVLNIRPDTLPNTYVNFDHIGGITGALKYIYRGPGSAIKYICRRIFSRCMKKLS
ncbi:TPA: alpha-L-Rha alpha-1,3-L-rhamnosyltransferase [Streptococcus suis]|uniref:rhamnan synthesis F family protein n=1 Tax=Streptococcus suis TaxID=1307 RepID=UPI002412AEF7|nr:rhamnan synthesis F family protein [Streptococcus suis]MDG4519801.1 rhamnan synthesis F family protein [Streptococcus suis]HEL1542263.1 alpha-L-Rha alpha-1,3-L-rhamnosyltransferase [Streptococcus suis]HEL1837738.1 alpha-L-Rha alpha-1,3-L-rhamnosyltransferase [Streptococcus suis]HEL1959631.1 alpha-L-Rha alpha-1,3-L-rhamnosyltransferase [Streptococcus suis]HEL2474698.1 alpha-L-Rha alpha-1,3-L-rhamnosyltransferase [Streptococcus suis]